MLIEIYFLALTLHLQLNARSCLTQDAYLEQTRLVVLEAINYH